jgi:glutaminase
VSDDRGVGSRLAHGGEVLDAALAEIVERFRPVRTGDVASYIPELEHVDPDTFGIALCSPRGHVYAAGDDGLEFTVQSTSKAFAYALAVTDVGVDEVGRHVGFEPSGDAFNAISLDAVGRPDNPMINAGAIVTTSLIRGADADERFDRLRSFMSRCAGRDLGVDEHVFRSELATGDRNRALGYLTRASGSLVGEVADATATYFRQCSILVTVRDLAVMGATLANNGVNPITGDAVVTSSVAQTTLAVMTTCGMYDYSGEWMVRVGLPAKSGVGGGIVAVKPGQFGVGVFSPRLDERGNSVRGVRVLEHLSSDLDLHLMAHARSAHSAVAQSWLDDLGAHVALVGELDFVAAEDLVVALETLFDGPLPAGSTLELDFSRVTVIRPTAERVLAARRARLTAAGVHVVVIDPGGVVAGHETAAGERLVG